MAEKRATVADDRRTGRLQRLELYSKGSYVAILMDGSRIPVFREGHARLKALLGEEDGKA